MLIDHQHELPVEPIPVPEPSSTKARALDVLGKFPLHQRAVARRWHLAFASAPEDRKGRLPMAWQKETAARMGVDARTVRRKWSQWLHNGRDEVAVADFRAMPSSGGLSEEFKQWWKALQESYQRCSATAYTEFALRWKRGEAIPGLDPELPRHEMPHGCSKANLSRIKPRKIELAAARRGLGHARGAHGPQVFSTRADLWPGSHLMLDDVWHNNFVRYRGDSVRVLEFVFLDLFSGAKVGSGCKPRERQENGTMGGLSERQVRLLMASHLWSVGYSPEGLWILSEHGTACISERIAQVLHDRTRGVIQVRYSGITGREQALAGDWWGKGKGNSRHKASLESFHRVAQNLMAAIPGQTGMNPDHRPEQVTGMLEYEKFLRKVSEECQLPQHVRDSFRHVFWDYHTTFLPALMHFGDVLNRRTDHDLEGWAEAGLKVPEVRWVADSPDWIGPARFDLLSPSDQELLRSRAGQDGRLLRERRLSPWEAWTGRRRSPFVKIPAFVVGEILGEDLAREQVARDSYFEFEDQELSPSALRYESRVTTPEGIEYELKDDKYLVFANPFNLDELFVCDGKMRHLGVARRDKRVSRLDHEALVAAHKRVREREADLLAEQRARQAPKARTNLALRNGNVDAVKDHLAEQERLKEAGRKAIVNSY